MKKLIEAYKKEEQTEYLYVVLAVVIVICSRFEDILLSEQSPLGTDYVVTGVFSVCIALWFLFLFRAMKHDSALDEAERDEREIQHEYQISHEAYRILIILIGLYWFFFDFTNLWLVGIVATTLLVRLFYRMHLTDDE
jgi:hypothetical protein